MSGVDSVDLDFFRVSATAVEDARLLRLVRVLESLINRVRGNQSAVAPVSFTIFAHLTVSDLMNAANCSGVDGAG